ncbi:unnamed protein product, partial [Owenia fusiformis]
ENKLLISPSAENEPSTLASTKSQPSILATKATAVDQPSYLATNGEDHSSNLATAEDQSLTLVIAEVDPLTQSTKEDRPLNLATREDRPSNLATSVDQPSYLATLEDQPSILATLEDQPSISATAEDHPSTLAMTEVYPFALVTNKNQPSIVATQENQPPNLVTAEGEPSALVTTEKQPSSLATQEDQPSIQATEEVQPSILAKKEDVPSILGTAEVKPSILATADDQPSTLGTGEDQPLIQAKAENKPPNLATSKDVQQSTLGIVEDKSPTLATADDLPLTRATIENDPSTLATKVDKPLNLATVDVHQSTLASAEDQPSNQAAAENKLSNLASTEDKPLKLVTPDVHQSTLATAEDQPLTQSTVVDQPFNQATAENILSNLALIEDKASKLVTPDIQQSALATAEDQLSHQATAENKPSDLATSDIQQPTLATSEDKSSRTDVEPLTLATAENCSSSLAPKEDKLSIPAATQDQPSTLAITKVEPLTLATTGKQSSNLATTEDQPSTLGITETKPFILATKEDQPIPATIDNTLSTTTEDKLSILATAEDQPSKLAMTEVGPSTLDTKEEKSSILATAEDQPTVLAASMDGPSTPVAVAKNRPAHGNVANASPFNIELMENFKRTNIKADINKPPSSLLRSPMSPRFMSTNSKISSRTDGISSQTGVSIRNIGNRSSGSQTERSYHGVGMQTDALPSLSMVTQTARVATKDANTGPLSPVVPRKTTHEIAVGPDNQSSNNKTNGVNTATQSSKYLKSQNKALVSGTCQTDGDEHNVIVDSNDTVSDISHQDSDLSFEYIVPPLRRSQSLVELGPIADEIQNEMDEPVETLRPAIRATPMLRIRSRSLDDIRPVFHPSIYGILNQTFGTQTGESLYSILNATESIQTEAFLDIIARGMETQTGESMLDLLDPVLATQTTLIATQTSSMQTGESLLDILNGTDHEDMSCQTDEYIEKILLDTAADFGFYSERPLSMADAQTGTSMWSLVGSDMDLASPVGSFPSPELDDELSDVEPENKLVYPEKRKLKQQRRKIPNLNIDVNLNVDYDLHNPNLDPLKLEHERMMEMLRKSKQEREQRKKDRQQKNMTWPHLFNKSDQNELDLSTQLTGSLEPVDTSVRPEMFDTIDQSTDNSTSIKTSEQSLSEQSDVSKNAQQQHSSMSSLSLEPIQDRILLEQLDESRKTNEAEETPNLDIDINEEEKNHMAISCDIQDVGDQQSFAFELSPIVLQPRTHTTSSPISDVLSQTDDGPMSVGDDGVFFETINQTSTPSKPHCATQSTGEEFPSSDTQAHESNQVGLDENGKLFTSALSANSAVQANISSDITDDFTQTDLCDISLSPGSDTHSIAIETRHQELNDELEKLRRERERINHMLAKDVCPTKVQVEVAEAQLNYMIGQTDTLLTSVGSDDSDGGNHKKTVHTEDPAATISRQYLLKYKSKLEKAKSGIDSKIKQLEREKRKVLRSREKYREIVQMKRKAQIEAFKFERQREEHAHRSHSTLTPLHLGSPESRSTSPSVMSPNRHKQYLLQLRKDLVNLSKEDDQKSSPRRVEMLEQSYRQQYLASRGNNQHRRSLTEPGDQQCMSPISDTLDSVASPRVDVNHEYRMMAPTSKTSFDALLNRDRSPVKAPNNTHISSYMEHLYELYPNSRLLSDHSTSANYHAPQRGLSNHTVTGETLIQLSSRATRGAVSPECVNSSAETGSTTGSLHDEPVALLKELQDAREHSRSEIRQARHNLSQTPLERLRRHRAMEAGKHAPLDERIGSYRQQTNKIMSKLNPEQRQRWAKGESDGYSSTEELEQYLPRVDQEIELLKHRYSQSSSRSNTPSSLVSDVISAHDSYTSSRLSALSPVQSRPLSHIGGTGSQRSSVECGHSRGHRLNRDYSRSSRVPPATSSSVLPSSGNTSTTRGRFSQNWKDIDLFLGRKTTQDQPNRGKTVLELDKEIDKDIERMLGETIPGQHSNIDRLLGRTVSSLKQSDNASRSTAASGSQYGAIGGSNYATTSASYSYKNLPSNYIKSGSIFDGQSTTSSATSAKYDIPGSNISTQSRYEPKVYDQTSPSTKYGFTSSKSKYDSSPSRSDYHRPNYISNPSEFEQMRPKYDSTPITHDSRTSRYESSPERYYSNQSRCGSNTSRTYDLNQSRQVSSPSRYDSKPKGHDLNISGYDSSTTRYDSASTRYDSNGSRYEHSPLRSVNCGSRPLSGSSSSTAYEALQARRSNYDNPTRHGSYISDVHNYTPADTQSVISDVTSGHSSVISDVHVSEASGSPNHKELISDVHNETKYNAYKPISASEIKARIVKKRKAEQTKK